MVCHLSSTSLVHMQAGGHFIPSSLPENVYCMKESSYEPENDLCLSPTAEQDNSAVVACEKFAHNLLHCFSDAKVWYSFGWKGI